MDVDRGDVARQSLRGFLAMVERDFPEEFLRIRTPVRTELDITSLVFELEHAGRSPVVMYENVEGHAMPVVTNIAGIASCWQPAWASAPPTSPPPLGSAARSTFRAKSSRMRRGRR
jgi:3-polyprenyl-4-hydroxybenzoate decarboxylase